MYRLNRRIAVAGNHHKEMELLLSTHSNTGSSRFKVKVESLRRLGLGTWVAAGLRRQAADEEAGRRLRGRMRVGDEGSALQGGGGA